MEASEGGGTMLDQMKKELFSLAESIYDVSKRDSVIVIGIMDKESATVTTWANCSDRPIIEHLIQEISGNGRAQHLQSLSSNASMDDVIGAGSGRTPRKVDMAV